MARASVPQITGGFLNVNKDAGLTSMDVLRQIKRITGQQKTQLSRYEWINRDAGILSIPIEVAMDKVVEEQSLESLIPAISAEAGDALNEQSEEEGIDEAEGESTKN